MKFEIKKTQEKETTVYKTLYIKQNVVEKINEIAKQHNTSWNNVVVSMIESCLTPENYIDSRKFEQRLPWHGTHIAGSPKKLKIIENKK